MTGIWGYTFIHLIHIQHIYSPSTVAKAVNKTEKILPFYNLHSSGDTENKQITISEQRGKRKQVKGGKEGIEGAILEQKVKASLR